MALSQRRVTLEDFLTWPERKPALEYEDGRITQKVSPKGVHSSLQTDTAELFNAAGKPKKVARAYTELRTTFGGRSYVPDVSVYRWDRIPRTPAGEVADDFFDPPDIAIEILSPSQRVNASVRRCEWYVANGTRISLLVNPRNRSVLLFRPSAEPVILRGPDPIDVSEILPNFRVSVEELFAALLV